MKKLVTTTAFMLMLISGLFISGCVDKEFDTPEPNVPHVDFTSDCTIAGLKAMCPASTIYEITNDTIIQGVIVGNDVSGNIYKSIYIQDETAGIQIALNQTGLYADYRVGQRIFVKCKGMFLGTYGKMIQIGYNDNGQIGQLPAAMMSKHLFLDSLPGAVPAAKVLTLPVSTSSLDFGMLVRFDNVHFEKPGDPYADMTTGQTATDRKLIDENGASVIVRNSIYSTFRSELMPDGVGTVYGILSRYNNTIQLYLRDLNDVVGFTPAVPPILYEGFSSGTLGSFTQQSVVGAQVWGYATYGGKNYASMSGYVAGSYYANEDWLISPALNLDAYANEKLSFETAMKYGLAGDGSLKLYYSTDYVSGAPSTGIWTEIPGISISTGNFVWASSGDIDMSAIAGTNVHFAFKFNCGTSNVPTWEVTNVKLKGDAI